MTAAGLCPVCQSVLGVQDPVHECTGCDARYHEECWTYNGGCGVYGCRCAATTEGLTSLEIPAGHWGKADKDCPRCGKSILAAAVRCRHCGATFDSAAPVETDDYRERERIKSSLPQVRRTAIILLVCSLVPFTAPFAAVIGGTWLAVRWRAIRRLPPVFGAISRIAVGVACLQTLLLVGAAVLNEMLRRT